MLRRVGAGAASWNKMAPRDRALHRHVRRGGGEDRDVLIHKGGGVWRTPPPGQTTPPPKTKKVSSMEKSNFESQK